MWPGIRGTTAMTSEQMTQKDVLDFKPASRLEVIGDEERK
jgi:hypothetical protein